MNIDEAKKFCKDNGIHQLNKGESLADAISHIKNRTPRKGYKYKHDDGRLMSENEIIENEYKEAFRRSFTPPDFQKDEVEDINNISDSEDFRTNKKERGVIMNCFYCGTCLRVDSGGGREGDYDSPEPETHCDECRNAAIYNLTM